MGDLGSVAEKCKSNQRTLLPHPHLTVGGVFAKLQAISASKGTRSAHRKQGIIAGLLRASRCAGSLRAACGGFRLAVRISCPLRILYTAPCKH